MLYVKVDQVRPNPWQTRQRPDEAWLAELAADVRARRATRAATKGLLQVPAGRLVTPGGERAPWREAEQAQYDLQEGALYVQLAYGHQRWAAFRLLAEEDAFYRHLPVDLVDFDDQEMATAAWAENWARRDLTPLEQARALALMMEDFGWTQAQVAERVGLSQPAVANKLRLLRLPPEMRAALQDGALSERQGLAILPLAELPEEAVAALPRWQQDEAGDLLERAGAIPSDVLRKQAGQLVDRATRDLAAAPFPPDWEAELEGARAATCEGCGQRWAQGTRCADPACYGLRADAWRLLRLHEVAAAIGGAVRVLDPAEARALAYNARRTFYESDADAIAFAQEHGCENLHLAWREGDYHIAAGEAYPEATWICVHGNRKECTCRSGLDAEAAARRKAEQKAENKARREVLDGLAARLARALDAGETGALRAVLVHATAYSQREKMAGKTARADVVQALAHAVVRGALYWEGMTPAEAETKAAEWARPFGLDGDMPQAPSLQDIRRRWIRIRGWMEYALNWQGEGPLNPAEMTEEALRGNLANLERLRAELVEVPISREREDLEGDLAIAYRALEELVEAAA